MSELKVIARIRNGFPEKFGIPRQSNLVEGLRARIVFEPEYRNADALRGLEAFSHIWLIWGFSEAERKTWSPTVRPPRLGGNMRMGVFATRSPFRPNALGLSCVQLAGIEPEAENGPCIHVLGADLMDGTPIYDIKPYIPFADSHPHAKSGFAAEPPGETLRVEIAERWLMAIPAHDREVVKQLLAHDPRPAYQNDPERVYGMQFDGVEIKFAVAGDVLTVISAAQIEKQQ